MDSDLQASDQPARAALPVPPQPELLAVAEVGAPVTMVNEPHPTGKMVKVTR